MKILFLMLISFVCFAQVHRPIPVLCMADELDIHNRMDASSVPEVVKSDKELLEKINNLQDIKNLYSLENSRLLSEIAELKEQRRLEKKIAGVAGLILFASGNESLKNIGLISLFCYSIW